MLVPFAYSRRNLIVRWKTTLMTAAGFTLVTAALVVMLAFVEGLRRVCVTSGDPRNVLVMVRGSNDEAFSKLEIDVVARVENEAGVAARGPEAPLSSRELFVGLNALIEATGETRDVQTRGVLPAAFTVHHARIGRGRVFRAGLPEAVVGRGLQRQLGLDVGDDLLLGGQRWTVVGVFDAGGAAFETELWCDLGLLAGRLRRDGDHTTVVLATRSIPAAAALARRLNESSTVGVSARIETQYYEAQAQQTNRMLAAAVFIGWFMAVGAVFGVMNTMFAAIGQRRGDIATMRLLGFGPSGILLSFLLESLLIAALGGLAGLALGSSCDGLTQMAGVGGKQVEFAFRVDFGIVFWAVGFVAVMGLAGGILPALTAMRVRPLEALRQLS